MDSYYISHAQFPCCQYVSVIHLSQLINQYHYVSIHSTPYLVQISFILCILFLFLLQDPIQGTQCIQLSCFLVASGLKSFSGFSCFLSCFDSFKEYWSCILENVTLGVYHVFFQVEIEGLWEEDHRDDMHFLSHQECMLSVRTIIITDKVDIGHLTEIAFASHYKVFFVIFVWFCFFAVVLFSTLWE